MNDPQSVAHFTGVDIEPHWRIRPPTECIPPWPAKGSPTTLLMAPGVGFGLGNHETTQLCLLALAYLLRVCPPPRRVLDFGAGSGILGIAAAVKSGAQVEAVEIDDAANEHARENARLNRVGHLMDVRTRLSEPPASFDLVLANILRPVLLEYAEALCARLATTPGALATLAPALKQQPPAAHLVLSGLVATDVPAILARYTPLLETMRPDIYSRGEWRAVVYSSDQRAGWLSA